MKRILLVATSSWAGMGPYASEIVNCFNKCDNVYFFLVEDERHYFSKNILLDIKEKGTIIYRQNSRINKLKDLFCPSHNITKQLNDICREKNISVIHFLTSEVPYYKTIIHLQKLYKVFFTVHDLFPHESKKIFYKEFRQNLMYKRLYKIRNSVDNLVTNSHHQYKILQNLYPPKNIFYFEFPSLINNTILDGTLQPKELKGIDNYILFFGRVELYKGIDLAYDVFCNYDMPKNTKLVIAGSGDLYFQRNISKEKNIIFINRYIKDEEIAYLFEHSIITLYPYKSATQSGVLSLSCYYGKPIIASDVSYFKVVESNELGLNFKSNNKESLHETLIKMLTKIDLEQISRNQREFYKQNYSKYSLRKSLLEIYNK